jgi:hypothetical protein
MKLYLSIQGILKFLDAKVAFANAKRWKPELSVNDLYIPHSIMLIQRNNIFLNNIFLAPCSFCCNEMYILNRFRIVL